MMMYRALVVGLLGAIALLVALDPDSRPRPAAVAVADVAPDDEVPATAVVDVARAHAGADPMPLLGLHPGERVTAVDGVVTDGVGLIGRWDQAFPGEYVDVAVRDGAGHERRILVLVHP